MSRSTPPIGPGRGHGQATVELAVGFPIVVLGVLLVLQLVLVGRDAVLVTHAAREAARAAAVDPTARAARDGATTASTTLAADRIEVDLIRRGSRVTALVRYRSLTRLPVVGALLPDVTISSSATMAVEPD